MRERERKERKEHAQREEREREVRREGEQLQKTVVDVQMRSHTLSPQQGSNEDEDDWGYLDAIITKIKDDFRKIRRQGPSRVEIDRLQSKLEAE